MSSGAFDGDHEVRSGAVGFLKPLVTVLLYSYIFLRVVDVRALAVRLLDTRLDFFAAAVLLYVAGQVLSAYKWYLLLKPVRLLVSYGRVVSFYFTGMFFNIFLPTIVGGDAVKAILLARETGAPARATISVFMERNLGLVALLSIAVVAARLAPPVRLFGFPLVALTLVLSAGFVAANLLLVSGRAYSLVDTLIAMTPLSRMRPRATSLFEALVPYKQSLPTLLAAIALSFVFQAIVIVVVFLNARALGQAFPMSAVAVFVPIISLAGMLPISVNGLGVREAFYLLLFGQLGATADVSVSLGLLYFAVTLAASLPGGVVYALQRPARLRQNAPGTAQR